MTDRIAEMRAYFFENKEHHKFRRELPDAEAVVREYDSEKLDATERAVRNFEYLMANETPVIFPFERIAFLRTVKNVPKMYAQGSGLEGRTHESGVVGNICVDYGKLLHCGFGAKITEIEGYIAGFEAAGETEKAEYLKKVKRTLLAVLDLAGRYRDEAERCGNRRVSEILSRIPYNSPNSFAEALQMFRIIHYAMWCSNTCHCPVGRFDQYMYPYFIKDIESGALTREDALEMLEELFISFNRDNDLYPGVQQGDNGQSMVLGGLNEDGTDSYNLLSELCLDASLELSLIDPKINLRVNKKTPLSLFEKGTALTRKGLGFPQYSNDDVVIKALTDWGYEKSDAYNYVVAACWEFIIPGCGMEIPNVDAFSFAGTVARTIKNDLMKCENFEKLRECVRRNICEDTAKICGNAQGITFYPNLFLSVLMDGCIENARDISFGSKYNNYGIHGSGLSTAADSLAAVKKFVFEDGSVTKSELLDALDKNYEGCDELYHKLRYNAPKMGNNDDFADEIGCELLDAFADSLEGKTNDRGGIFRAGTGTAMYYIWQSREVGATPDGRKAGEPFSANYSPSLFAKCKGPISVFKSFTKPNLSRVANGGPLTIELHDTVFRSDDSIKKIAMVVKSYVDMGGHQLQLNSINRDKLLDAQKNPDNYKNLIVRVWGWSGYFIELDKEYQEHIIARTEFVI